jgi:hypothetical protein
MTGRITTVLAATLMLASTGSGTWPELFITATAMRAAIFERDLLFRNMKYLRTKFPSRPGSDAHHGQPFPVGVRL